MLRYFYILIGWRHFKKVLMLLGVVWLYQTFWMATPNLNVPQNPNATALSEAEQEYYQQHFNYAMAQTAKQFEQYWNTHSGSGIIVVGERFKSTAGYDCRPFRERYTIGVQSGEATGFGCKRQGVDGWCKLKPEHPKNCALESPKTMLGRIKQTVSDDYGHGKTLIKGTIDFW